MRVVGQRGMCTLKILELLEEIKTDEGKKTSKGRDCSYAIYNGRPRICRVASGHFSCRQTHQNVPTLLVSMRHLRRNHQVVPEKCGRGLQKGWRPVLG